MVSPKQVFKVEVVCCQQAKLYWLQVKLVSAIWEVQAFMALAANFGHRITQGEGQVYSRQVVPKQAMGSTILEGQ